MNEFDKEYDNFENEIIRLEEERSLYYLKGDIHNFNKIKQCIEQKMNNNPKFCKLFCEQWKYYNKY